MMSLTKRALVCAAALAGTGGCYHSVSGSAEDTDSEGGDGGSDDDSAIGDSSGDGDGPELGGPGTCVETAAFFRDSVWAPFMSTQCFACHNPSGEARHTDLVLQAADVPGYADANLATLRGIARLEIDGEPLLLLKPLAEVEHGGGQQLLEGDERHVALEELVAMLGESPIACADDADVAAFFKGVQQLDEVEVLRRAAFVLASRLPTAEELQAVRAGGEGALGNVLRALMTEEGFYTRLAELFNESLLTDKYATGTMALDLLSPADYPGVDWYMALPEGTVRNTARNRSNLALAREPLEIIRYVVEHDRPFTDIVAGHYTVANPFLARVYGLDLSGFTDVEDPDEWREVAIEGIPHAGLLTTPSFLNRYPTTDTNRNRMRAQYTLDFFLATDVMTLGARPIGTDAVAEHNPTLNNNECTSCHEILDPVAGAFQNWDDLGRFRPATWYQEMRAPGLGDEVMPSADYPASLQWLGGRIASDARFSRAVVELAYAGLMGRPALSQPTDPTAVDYAAQIKAFGVQDAVFKGVAETFVDSGYDLRELLVALTLTPYFRASNVEAVDAERALELADVGAIRLSSPEQLHRRIAVVTGYAWQDEGANLLTLGRPLHLMYGGINSDSVTEPFEDVNGVMVNVARRMGNEMACLATAQDFARSAAERVLFPFVDPTSIPALDDAAIRDNVQYLHERVLGEELDDDDPILAETVELFTQVYEDGMSGLAAGEYSATLIGPCRAMTDPVTGDPLAIEVVEDPDYTIRAWMAVVSAMLGDFRFIYE